MLHQSIRAIPPFETGYSVFRRLARLYAPKEPLTVSEWAIRHRGFDPESAPWQAEIMDALGDPGVTEVGLMGPAQQGKTEIGLAWMGWSIEHDVADMLVCQPSKDLADDFAKTRIGRMVADTPALKEALLPQANADNIFLKQFQGMFLRTVWPVAGQFRQRPVPRGWLDDFDEIPDDIDGQGSAIGLLDSRAESFEGRDKKYISSTPARENGGGIEGFCDLGTDERLMPICPSCGERIELDMIRDLRFDRTPNLDDAEATAHVICPSGNGCVLEGDDRRRLLDSLIALPNKGWVVRNERVGRRRRTFRIDGLLGFKSWGERARQRRAAEIEWELRQDEAALRAFYNTKAGRNYRSQLSGEKPLDTKDVQARHEPGWKSGTVPAGCKVVVITVDVQHNRFECAAVGWGEKREMWLIDRWSIDTLADGLTILQPLRYREHWAALLPLFSREWKLADGSAQGVQALTVAIDARGGESELAIGFWHLAAAAGIHPTRVTLLQGGNSPKAPMISSARRSDQKTRGGTKRNSPSVWTINTHWLKNIVDAMLRRISHGPGFIHLPGDFADQHADEMTAERLEKGKWIKIRPRNETWDLIIYALAAILRPPFAQSRLDMRWVPAAFRVPEQASAAPVTAEPIVDQRALAPVTTAPIAARPRAQAGRSPPAKNWIPPRKAGWIGRPR